MKAISDEDKNKVDVAAEQLAKIFIEQAKYNRLHKKKDESPLRVYPERIKLDLRYKWIPVFANKAKEYHFPDKTTPYMRSKYKCPAIYRWHIYQNQPEDKKIFYIGETELFYRRIGHYLKPDGSQQTNQRIREKIDKYIADKLKIKLEVLQLEISFMGKIPLTSSELMNKYVRHCIEALLITNYQNKGYTLLNL